MPTVVLKDKPVQNKITEKGVPQKNNFFKMISLDFMEVIY